MAALEASGFPSGARELLAGPAPPEAPALTGLKPSRRFPIPLALYFSSAAFLGFLFGLEWWFGNKESPQPLIKLVGINLTTCLVWAFIGLGIWLAVVYFPVRRPRVVRDFGMHILFAIAAAGLQMLRYLSVTWYFSLPADRVSLGWVIPYFFRNEGISYGVIYFGLALLLRGILADREAQESKLQSARLAEQLASAELLNLKAQIHPHLLFNTLNSISSLMRRDADATDLLIERLGNLLRASLDLGRRQEVPLETELYLAERYLEIQKIRFSRKLAFTIAAAPGVLNSSFPPLLLQPLVENAVTHGIAESAEQGMVRLTAGIEGNQLRICIFNTIPLNGANRKNGLGLKNTADRLRLLFGDQATLKTEKTAHEFKAILTIPYRPSVRESLPV